MKRVFGSLIGLALGNSRACCLTLESIIPLPLFSFLACILIHPDHEMSCDESIIIPCLIWLFCYFICFWNSASVPTLPWCEDYVASKLERNGMCWPYCYLSHGPVRSVQRKRFCSAVHNCQSGHPEQWRVQNSWTETVLGIWRHPQWLLLYPRNYGCDHRSR